MRRSPRLAFLLAVPFALVAVGCGSSSSGPTTPPADTGTKPDTAVSDTPAGDSTRETGDGLTVMVGQGGLTFSPATLSVKVGDTVTWKWAGSGHSVTSGSACTADKKFDSGAPAGTGTTFTFKFDTAGDFPYFCVPHCAAGMTGTITVK